MTVKSDDVVGRTRVYEAIVKGEPALHAGTPESFNVLVKELQSLVLDIIPEKSKQATPLDPLALAAKKLSDTGEESLKEKLKV